MSDATQPAGPHGRAASDDLARGPTLAAGTGGSGERLDAGARAGEYVVERFLGAGAMGEVYAGRHPVIGKKVAIKVLKRDLASAADAVERFKREARAAVAIDHPNVVDVFAFGNLDDGRFYLVMDLVDGSSLRARLADGPLDLPAALEVLDATADALDAAHARGVIHRDLKPDNIVISSTNKVFVLDFGIAKLVSSASDGGGGPGTLTGQGTWLGTPGYMAPEQWSADGAVAASDRYALGVIAYELLAGKLPFAAASVPAMMEQHFRAEVPRISETGKTIPPALDPVLRRALAKDPDARFATAREFVGELRAAAGTGIRARAAVAPPSAPARIPWKPAAAGVAVLGAMVVGAVAMRGGGGHEERRDNGGRVDPPTPIGVAIATIPAGADIVLGDPADNRGQAVIGTTPTQLQVTSPMDVTIVKAGYLPEHRHLVGGEAPIELRLVAIDRFAGTWRLPRGELRRLERVGEVVDVYKVSAVGEAGTFYRHYKLVPATSGVAFADDDELVDPRARTEPTCHVPVHVEYRYDPARDVLELRRDVVDLDLRGDGHCVVRDRRVDARALERVDAALDTVTEMAPAGGPLADEIAKKNALKVATKPKAIGKKAPPKKPVPDTKDLDVGSKSAPPLPPQQKLAPEQQAPPSQQPAYPQQAPPQAPPPNQADRQQQQAPIRPQVKGKGVAK